MSTPPDSSTPAAPTSPGHTQADADRVMIVGLILSMVMIVLVVPHLRHQPSSLAKPDVRAAIDPNVAPWWELTVLPNIGPALAGEIVRYRAAHVAAGPDGDHWFTKPSELTKVRGIGPKTVAGISEELVFGPN